MGNPPPIWEDEVGEVQEIPQGEGGDQGDPLMPLIFSLTLHPSLRSAAKLLREGEKIFAFLDDVHLVCTPDRVLEVFRIVEKSSADAPGSACISAKRNSGTHQSCPSGASTSSRVARRSKFAS